MTNLEWKKFFDLGNEVLGAGSQGLLVSENWCSWTTFDRLLRSGGYWQCGLPRPGEYHDWGVGDGGVWGQPFRYEEIAHLIVPRTFEFADIYKGEFIYKKTEQKIDALSDLLLLANIDHILSDWALEFRLIKPRAIPSR
jgi:hypothetical protein